MSNISDQSYALYERLASASLNALVSEINSHNHGSSGGVSIDLDAAIPANSLTTAMFQLNAVDGTILAADSVTTSHIVNGTITNGDLNLSSIHLVDGYAVYSA